MSGEAWKGSTMLLVCCLLLAGLCVSTPTPDHEPEKLLGAQIDWLVSRGGTVNSKVHFRRTDPDDSSAPFGLFAIDDIHEGDTLLKIPQDTLITAGDDLDECGGLCCPVVHRLIHEMKLADDSEFAPYVNYLLSQRHGQLPSVWSEVGQKLLLEILAQNDDDMTNDLNPEGACEWLKGDWHVLCRGSHDPFDENAAMLVLQRSWDDTMIPIFDLMNHRNGRWLNTNSTSVHNKSIPVHVWASRNIKAGEQIFNTYTYCTDCEGRFEGYGTPEILRDFGFVEQFPQRWFFDTTIWFEVDAEYDEQGADTGQRIVNWLQEYSPSLNDIRSFIAKLDRLTRIADIEFDFKDLAIPQNEWDIVVEFYNATSDAMKLALTALGVNYTEKRCTAGNDEACSLTTRYDDLAFKEDRTDYAVYTCDSSLSLAMDNFKVLEDTHSHYQNISIAIDPENSNVCLDIENTIQICDSYRPQYHEMVTHYPARFLSQVKRILFVGGGDSMLLHEIIKYKSLEVVVGLELDQYITRLSFKHTGTQPHFDNSKVQWWFGDAAKSLLMLPESFFGSFDMVLVDLSETVASLLVTDRLDILQALSLLLKPDGIFVKNELYLEKMADIFDYSIQIHYPSVPVVCSQCIIMGSKKVDFLYQPLTDHPLNSANLYIQNISEIKDRYEYVHDYVRNATVNHLCTKVNESTGEPDEQIRSPGILMIVEMEESTVDLRNTARVLEVFLNALANEGLEKVSSLTSETINGASIFVVVREGYIMARTYPEHRYCAIDIHLWSSFEKHDAVKMAIVHAIGTRTPSSYRIVAGGMFGVDTWKDDQKKRGPRVTNTCEENDGTTRRQLPMDSGIVRSLLDESIKLVNGFDQIITVVCGEMTHGCQSLDILSKKGYTAVIPLWACPGIAQVNEFQEGSLGHMIQCEKELRRALLSTLSPHERIRAIILDPGVSLQFAQVAYRVFHSKKSRLFQKDLLGIAVVTIESELWRRHFMERLRTDVILYDTNFRAEVLFNSTDSSIELDVFSSEDPLFVHRIRDVIASIENRTALVSDVREIRGGLFVEDPNWHWTHFFLPEDYDQRSPLEQYMSQQPVGYQTVLQLVSNEGRMSLSTEDLKKALQGTVATLKSTEWSEIVSKAELHEGNGIGEGCVVATLWSGGNCVALWDGRDHIDLNIFTFIESEEFANDFASVFQNHLLYTMETALRDVQPRGYGRVVNFRKDIEPRVMPHWARFKE